VISSVFPGSALSPLAVSQQRTSSYPIRAEVTAAWVVAEMAYMAPSSTYNMRSLWDQHIAMSRREAMYKANKMGERGEPCGIPLWTAHGAEVCVPIFRDTVCPVRKEWTQSHTYMGKPLRWNICVVRSGFTKEHR
jgi:hypothetical protein